MTAILKWSRSRPTQPGWYWNRLGVEDPDGTYERVYIVALVFVLFSDNKLFMKFVGTLFDCHPSDKWVEEAWDDFKKDIAWCGPIVVPRYTESAAVPAAGGTTQ